MPLPLVFAGAGALGALLAKEYFDDATAPVTNAVTDIASVSKVLIYGGGAIVLLYLAKRYGLIKI